MTPPAKPTADHPIIFDAHIETWPLAEAFVIARGAKTAATVVVVEARADLGAEGPTGRGECVPYARYGETPASVLAQIGEATSMLAGSASPARARQILASDMPAGAARNALDCALFDLEAKLTGREISELAGLRTRPAEPILTAYTLSLDTPEAMASKARAVSHLPLLKLKLGGPGDGDRMRAVRTARPDARLIADANESWTDDLLRPLLAVAADTGCELVEQPLPAGADGALAALQRPVPVCADESLHTRTGLSDLTGRYDAINIKLDKAGGLTEAIALMQDARMLGLEIMVGSMVSTSLAVAPALLIAEGARWVDLDGPLLLARDREAGLTIENGRISPASSNLWG